MGRSADDVVAAGTNDEVAGKANLFAPFRAPPREFVHWLLGLDRRSPLFGECFAAPTAAPF